jgi:hypothetical protein
LELAPLPGAVPAEHRLIGARAPEPVHLGQAAAGEHLRGGGQRSVSL